MKIEKASGLYQTEAWGMEDVNDFLNQALMVKTSLEPEELLKVTEEIEQEAGREKTNRDNKGYESRKLDIDILLFDDRVIQKHGLTIPHPRMHLRNFTLLPLAEIAPDWTHPVLNKKVEELMDKTPDKLSVRRL